MQERRALHRAAEALGMEDKKEIIYRQSIQHRPERGIDHE
jgi:hypothetical protein